MCRLVLSFLILFGYYYSFSQNYRCLVKQGLTWGYIDQTGNMIIEPRFKEVTKFSEDGFAAVITSKTIETQIIDRDGKVIETEPKLFSIVDGYVVKGFCDGFIAVTSGTNKKWGYLGSNGKWLVPVKFKSLTDFSEGFGSGEFDGLWFIITSKGKEIPVKIKGVKVVKKFSEGLAPFCTRKGCGFLNSNGEQVIADNFQTVGYFSGGLAWAKDHHYKVGFIDKTGKWVIEPTYSAVNSFDPVSKMAKIKINQIWSFIDTEGKPLKLKLFSSGDFSDGLCFGKLSTGKIGFFDKTGNWVIEPRFVAVRDFKNGFAAAREDRDWGIINKKGEWVVEPKFERIGDMELIK